MADPTTAPMQWVNALSNQVSLEAAVKDVVERTTAQLQGSADLALVFISSAFSSELARVMPLLKEHLSVPALIGCSGGGIVGDLATDDTREIEDAPALSLTLAHLPGVAVKTFHIDSEHLPDLDDPPQQWADLVDVSPTDQPSFVLLSDAMSSGINDLLQGLDFAYPGAVKVGGLATGGSISGSGLFCDYHLYREGTVGLALSGQVVMETIVAQGCRPIGNPYRVVEGDRNILMKLEEQGSDAEICTPLEALQNLYQTLDEADQALAQNSLFVGIAQNEFKQTLEQGDFLIRNLLGVDPRIGAIAIGDRVRAGQRIQFHLRDARASADDLEALLERYATHLSGPVPAGALMFACAGRGEQLYGQPNFDSSVLRQYFEHLPVSGFFCGGEIGPVGESTFLHGYTSVFALCREP